MAMEKEAGADAGETHVLELTAWDVPSATGAGERFAVAVGAHCSCGCDLGGREVSLFDQHGAAAGTVKLGSAVWPGTEALYFAGIEARAPLEAGSHQWEARMTGWDGEPPHAAGSFPLGVRVVAAPDCEVTVIATDRESQAPIAGARVVLHPYRAVTDASGIARVKVARGRYEVLVSGRHYLPCCSSIEVTADAVAGVELDAEPSPDEVLE